MRRATLALASLLLAAHQGMAQPTGSSGGRYDFVADLELGPPGFFDYLTYDPAGRRLYAAHVDRLTVVDVARGAVVGQVSPIDEAHGSAITKLGKGYVASGGDGMLKVFRLADLKIIKQIKVGADCDGVVFDPGSGAVLVVSGDGRSLTVVDPATDTIKHVIALPDQPEYLAADGLGHVYINLTTTAQIAKVDIRAGKVLAIWKMADCEKPHGLAYDPAGHRLFSGCTNKKMVVVDAATGRNLAAVPIGPGSDSVVWDTRRQQAVSSNVDGTMTVVLAVGNSYTTRTIPTFFGGRNLTIDPASGELFIAHGHMKLLSSLKDLLNLRFGWDGLDIAIFKPQP